MLPEIRLTSVSREDVQRVAEWLRDEEVNASWYGTNEQGEPLHIGYSPGRMLEASASEWEEVFGSEQRKLFSVLNADGQHIGEGQMVIEAPLWEAQLLILIGRKDLWYRAMEQPPSCSFWTCLSIPTASIGPGWTFPNTTCQPSTCASASGSYWRDACVVLTQKMGSGTTLWLWGSCPANTPAAAPGLWSRRESPQRNLTPAHNGCLNGRTNPRRLRPDEGTGRLSPSSDALWRVSP